MTRRESPPALAVGSVKSPCSAWTQERYLKAGAKRQGKQILNQYTYMNVAKESGKQRVGLDGWKCPYPLRQRRKSGE